MASQKGNLPDSAGGSPAAAAPGSSGGETVRRKKVYNRVLLWMLDMKSLSKDMKISPLVEVSYANVAS